jgi:translation initiation factor IF-2
MSESKGSIRLSKMAGILNVSSSTILDALLSKGHRVENNPNTKLTEEQVALLEKQFAASKKVKAEASGINIGANHGNFVIDSSSKLKGKTDDDYEDDIMMIRDNTPKIHSKELNKTDNSKKDDKQAETKGEVISAKLPGLNIVGKIELSSLNKPRESRKNNPTANTPTKNTQKQTSIQKEEPIQPVIEPKEQVVIPPIVEATPEPISVLKVEEPVTPIAKTDEIKQEMVKQIQVEEEIVHENSIPNIQEKEVLTDEDDNEIEDHDDTDELNEDTFLDYDSTDEPVIPLFSLDEDDDTLPIQLIEARAEKLQGLKVVGKIELPVEKKKYKNVGTSDDKLKDKRKKRKRLSTKKDELRAEVFIPNNNDRPIKLANSNAAHKTDNNSGRTNNANANTKKKHSRKDDISEKEIEYQYKKTLSDVKSKGNKAATKRGYKEKKRNANLAAKEREMQEAEHEAGILRVTEFISANDLASLMDIPVTEIIVKCLQLGMFVAINQRLDAATISLIAEEFGFNVEFTSAEEEFDVELEEEDDEVTLETRAPIVTIMGHVDHGKTTLLDFIRKSKVAEGEAGGITQHIGAYDVTTESGRRLVFLDTPGHEAFTAMRARGAQVTDVAIIVIAADGDVMPQTIEAINHAQVAGVPFVIAINKIDKPGANPNRIKEQLANKVKVLVEDWGGKILSQEISAKQGLGVDALLEAVLLEADILELKANPNKKAVGTVIEASLDKGRGYVATVLVQAGTLRVGDVILAGQNYGRVKAMTDHKGTRLKEAGPSTPVQILGFNGAPQAGDRFNVLESDREAKEIATRREQILREQSIRATKRVTLDQLGKRLAQGSFQELNIILKGDVDGSVEALSQALFKLSHDEVAVNILHQAVGPITESDVLLASASDAVVIGFQVRPTPSAKKLADKEAIEIRTYSIIYDAINDVKDAMEGMLAPSIEETIVGNVEVREVFKISKVGTIAGCMVTDGYIKRSSKIRIIRNGIVIYGGEAGGEIQALKRFKDDASEVKAGFECGVSIKNFNDIEVGDIIEVFEQKEVKRTLK